MQCTKSAYPHRDEYPQDFFDDFQGSVKSLLSEPGAVLVAIEDDYKINEDDSVPSALRRTHGGKKWASSEGKCFVGIACLTLGGSSLLERRGQFQPPDNVDYQKLQDID